MYKDVGLKRFVGFCFVMLIMLGLATPATAQFWAQRSDEINIGLMISHLRQVTHTNKPGNIGWIHAWPMTVDGVVMDDSTFRRQLGEIYDACAERNLGCINMAPPYQGVFGQFCDFHISGVLDSVRADSCVFTGTYWLYYEETKSAPAYLKFRRVEGLIWRLDTIDGYLPFLRSEIPVTKTFPSRSSPFTKP